MKYFPVFLSLFFIFLLSCQSGPGEANKQKEAINSGLSIEKESFGQTDEGEAFLFTIQNKNGIKIKVTNYGGIVTHLYAPDRNGKTADITLGFDSLPSYLAGNPYFGAIIGRYGNRIAGGKFTLDGNEYTLAQNNGPNSLHGGNNGFDKKLWHTKPIETREQVGLEFYRLSPDMEEGYPGNLEVTVRYLLNNDNEWIIEYEASTDKKTVVNLTQHTYFNLNGAGKGDILDHELMIKADHFTPVNETLIPTGEIEVVKGSPFDFTRPTPIGKRINENHPQLKRGGGYDHNFVLNRQAENDLEMAASLYEPLSGRFLEVLTTEPGIQFYSGNFLDGSLVGKAGKPYEFRSGLCLETQHFPNAPNQKGFPSTVLEPGQTYRSKTVYRFSVK